MEYVSISMGLCSHHTTQEGNPLCLPVWANWRRPSQPWSTVLTASWCQCALLLEETDVHSKINGNTGKENLRRNIEAMSVRKLKLGCNCIIQKYFQNGVRTTNLSQCVEVVVKKPWPRQNTKHVVVSENIYEQLTTGLYVLTYLTLLEQLCREEWTKVVATNCEKLPETFEPI